MSNNIRNLIINSLEVSKDSKVPVLFISNPGLGKTTTINEWAKRNSYHVISLIGSSFDRSEVMGYMVNTGKDYLELLKPNWFEEVLTYEAKGTPTVLFIDELSTAPSDVQGSLYRLIFERVDGAGRKLPEDCMIVSAANYKGNLPPQFSISAPALNRFCIVNLMPKSLDNFLAECLQPKSTRLDEWPEYSKNTLPKNAEDIVSNALSSMFTNYSSGNSSLGKLNWTNTYYDEVFDAAEVPYGEVLNFTSFRTIDYLKQMILSSAKLGIKDTDWFSAMSDGLIGLGFNSFNDVSQLRTWRKTVKEAVKTVIENLIAGDEYSNVNLFADDATLSEKVRVLSLASDTGNATPKELLKSTTIKIANEYVNKYPCATPLGMHERLSQIFEATSDPKYRSLSIAAFKADMNSLREFIQLVPNYIEGSECTSFQSSLKEILDNYSYYESSARL